MKYLPSEIEKKWQGVWEKEKIYSPNLDTARRPFYNLMMFPYPSAEGMHVGNMYTFTGADIYGRFKRMQGEDVFEPIGLDGFGIHSENYAIKVGRHPKEQAKISEKNFYRQLKATGNSYDWSRTVETYDPKYYKWTQWLFIQLFKAGLAYRKKAPVNFCPSCKTVLADEQVIDEKCERCSSIVEKKELEQWFFKITKYADRLLDGLSQIDWAEKIKIAQRQWIGKSEGTLIKFKIEHLNKEIEVFTTRADTLYGATFLVLAPEHPIWTSVKDEKIQKYINQAKKQTNQERLEANKEKTGVFSGLYAINPVNNEEIPIWIADYVLMGYGTGAIMAVPAHDQRDFEFAKKYNLPIKQVIRKVNAPIKSYLMGADAISDKELTELGIKIEGKTEKGIRLLIIPEKSLGAYEVLVSRKMTSGYWNEYLAKETVFLFKHKDGKVERIALTEETHDRIDKLGAELNEEVYEPGIVWRWLAENTWYRDLVVHTDYGVLINSGEFSGLESEDAKKKITEWLSKNSNGGSKITYHLRDWLISRQRYWGPPIPMINCSKCSWQPVPEDQLPVLLPDLKDWKPLDTASNAAGAVKSPLANHPEFYETNCPNCEGPAKRETDVSDTFLDSAWYFLRYIGTEFDKKPFDESRVKKWLPVNMYIGGAEHAVLHLLYSRFITMALHDLRFISFDEPFTKFYAHGLIIKDGAKMSKSKGNVVVPDAYIKKYGADALRCSLMFTGPFNMGGDFRDSGIEGMNRFLRRIWNLAQKSISNFQSPISNEGKRSMNQTIKKVTDDLENLRYNTAIASLMEYYNFLSSQKHIAIEEVRVLLKLLAPLAPHITEELWQNLRGPVRSFPPASAPSTSSAIRAVGNPATSATPEFKSVHLESWPKYDNKFLKEDRVTIAVQVNGKIRGTIRVESSKLKVQSYVEHFASLSANVKKHLIGKKIKKVIYVEGRIINFVTQ